MRMCSVVYMYALDIPRQPTCMKLGTGGFYQPIQSYMCKQGSYMSVAYGYPTGLI